MLSSEVVRSVESSGWVLHPAVARRQPLGEGGGATVYRVFQRDVIDNLVKLAVSTPAGSSAHEHAFAVLENVESWVTSPGLFCGALKVPKREEPRTRVEIRAMQECVHPRLVRILRSDEENREFPRWFIMDYYPRGTPRAEDYVNNVEGVLRQGANICDALEVLHRKGYFHRDIKPSNILVAADGGWVLGDLGIVLDDDRTRHTEGSLPGSKDWMPPWRMTKVSFDARFDLFMLAKTLHFLIAGEKMKAVSWLKEDGDFNLALKLAGIDGADMLQAFFERHIVEKPDAFPQGGAKEMGDQLRSLADIVSGKRPRRVLLAIPRMTGDEWNAEGISFFVPAGVSTLHVRTKTHAAGVMHLVLYDDDRRRISETQSPPANSRNLWLDSTLSISPRGDTFVHLVVGGDAAPPVAVHVTGR